MGIFTKKTIDRDFEDCELFAKTGEFKIYYPQTQEKLMKFLEIIQRSDVKDNEISFTGEDLVCDLFELLTNVNVDECIRGKEKLTMKMFTVSNYVQQVAIDTLELIMSQHGVEEAKERFGLGEKQEQKPQKVNRNDKEVIIEQWKEKEMERKIVEQELPQVEDIDAEIKQLEEEIEKKEKERKREELLKQLAELG